jgi:membrane protein required for beta-lactamase induction
MVASGVPRPNAFDFGTEDQDIHQALLAMAETLTTVKDYLNFFVNDLWENMVNHLIYNTYHEYFSLVFIMNLLAPVRYFYLS